MEKSEQPLIPHAISCMDDFDPNSMPCEIAQAYILESVPVIQTQEKVALRSALGRILAEDVQSNMNVPAHTNSAMDGYAVRAEDLPQDSTTTLTMIGRSFAGHPFDQPVQAGQCVRIMTGAVMPEGTDTVIMQEHVEVEADQIRIGNEHTAGQNVRMAGEDLAIGQTVLTAGKRLTPADLGLLASLGQGEVNVTRRLRVAFFSTGDELRSIGETLKAGEIFDSNRYTLYGMLSQLGVDLIDMGVILDTPEAVKHAFQQAADCADVVITSGGVSVGEADYIKNVLAEMGKVNFWKVAMKPGRPLTFGQIEKAVFFGLPGNPVSVMVTFYQFVQAALKRMMGEHLSQNLSLKARSTTALRKRPGRTEFQRGVLETDENGELVVHKTGEQGSGILRSMSEANCFIVLPQDSDKIEIGEWVNVQPFSDFV